MTDPLSLNHAALTLLEHRPDLSLVYLPHLDYDPQRFGPQGCDMPKLVRQLDDACAPLLDAARTGVVLSAIQGRDYARIYVKELDQGRPSVALSPEEQEAVERAMAR